MFISKNLEENPYIIAEVGQNHQGNLDCALNYVREFALRGASAIKFQKRNNQYLFDKDAYEKAYNSENSFGKSYGEHREALELSQDDFKKIKDLCAECGVDFMVTPFDEHSLNEILEVGVEILKVASFDLGNLPLIELMAQTKLPIVMSTGGGKNDHIDASIQMISKYHKNIALLHCVSEYPCMPEHLGLENITILSRKYPNLVVGISDHFNGTLSGPLAYQMGARVFEKHVTFNRSWKGTDHSFALEPEGFRKFVRDIRRVPLMMPTKHEKDIGNEEVFKKLGKSLVAAVPIKRGEIIKPSHLTGKIFVQNYILVREAYKIVGKPSQNDIEPGQPIMWDFE